MIAVIPVGRKRAPTLPYVLRSLEAHSDITRLVTVGEPPAGVTPDRHIPSANDQRTPYLNVLGHLHRAAESIDADRFVWMDNDMFLMAPWTPAVYVRKYSIARHLADYPNLGPYTAQVKAAVKVMVSQGHDPEQVPCGPIHRPWLVETDRVLATVKALEDVGGGSFKTLYVAGLDGVVPANDAKVMGRGVPKPGVDVVSTVSQSWRSNAGRIVREAFTEPSRWEIPALSAS